MYSVNEIVKRWGKPYQQQFSSLILPSHSKALQALGRCRTSAMGAHREFCIHCGYEHWVNHSCRNRGCPQCSAEKNRVWLEKQQSRILNTNYFHLVFTLPSELRSLVRRHQKALYPVLFRSAARSLQKLAMDSRYVGGELGIIMVLHTWSGAMVYHPHVHCLIPAGGVDRQGVWKPSRPDFLVPVKALSSLFRGLFLALARKTLPEVDFSRAGNVKKWVVFSKSVPHKKAGSVLKYLGRYIHRIAITNSRILKIENQEITFRYKRNQKGQQPQWKTMRLSPFEFLRRFLQHVLPKGLVKVRYYGFLAPGSSIKVTSIQNQLEKTTTLSRNYSTAKGNTSQVAELVKNLCPYCKHPLLVDFNFIPRAREPTLMFSKL